MLRVSNSHNGNRKLLACSFEMPHILEGSQREKSLESLVSDQLFPSFTVEDQNFCIFYDLCSKNKVVLKVNK